MAGPTAARGTVFKITPSGHADHALQLLLANRLHGRRISLRRAGAGQRRELLRDNLRGRGQRTAWHGLQNHPEWHADHALQLLLASELHGRRDPYAGLVQGSDGNFYGTTIEWRGQRLLWHGLQNHPRRHADHALQLLLPSQLR